MALSEEASPSDLHEWGNREKNTLVLNYTMQCPLRCDYCCYGCHPGRHEKMPLDAARNLVIQSAPFDDFTSLAFTGGEPLLFLDEVCELASLAKSLGKNTTIATAAHWASSPSETSVYIERLVRSGLNRLNVSYDSSHAEYVSIDNIYNVVQCAKEIQLPLYVVSTFYSDDQIGPEFDDPEHGIFHVKKIVAKVGRATKASVSYDLPSILSDFSCYRREFHDVVVFYDGKAYPCCSTFNRASPGLVVGNAFTDGFSEIRLRVLGSLLLRTIKRGSFASLVTRVAEYDMNLAGEINELPITGGACSFCSSVFRKPELYSRLYAAFDKIEADFIQSVVSGLNSRGVRQIELTE